MLSEPRAEESRPDAEKWDTVNSTVAIYFSRLEEGELNFRDAVAGLVKELASLT